MQVGGVDYDSVCEIACENCGGGTAEELGSCLGPETVGAEDDVAGDDFAAFEGYGGGGAELYAGDFGVEAEGDA